MKQFLKIAAAIALGLAIYTWLTPETRTQTIDESHVLTETGPLPTNTVRSPKHDDSTAH